MTIIFIAIWLSAHLFLISASLFMLLFKFSVLFFSLKLNEEEEEDKMGKINDRKEREQEK